MNHVPDKPGTKLIGYAVFALIVVGGIATIGGVAAIATNDYTGGGVLLIAAACSFGMLANALLRQ